jgi:predicted phage terminase large subunit-like protein
VLPEIMLSPDPLLARIDEEIAARIAAQGSAEDEEALRLEEDFLAFVEAAWPSIDSAEFQRSWVVEAMCEHLQAVANGALKRLTITVPPRCSKTLITSVCFPAWLWTQRSRTYLKGPQVKVLAASYGHTLSILNSNQTRRLILSNWFQSLWPTRFKLMEDQNTKLRFDTDAGGSRISTSVGGSLLGIGGDVVICDDLHDVSGIESEADRESVLRFFQEISSTRLNNPKEAAVIVVQQRLHEEDTVGWIYANSREGEWDHLMVPMKFDSQRCCQTSIGWTDPRGCDDETGEPLLSFPDRQPVGAAAAEILEQREGALLWPTRFGQGEVEALEASLGPYMASGRLQQAPTPKGGGIIRTEWFQLYDKIANGNKYPLTTFRVASLDGAYTDNEMNDPSAMTVFGIWKPPDAAGPRIILMDAWRKWLTLHGNPTPRMPDEIAVPGDSEAIVRQREAKYRQRAGKQWGLVEWVRATCLKFDVDVLLIEKAASGLSVAQEFQRCFASDGIAVYLITPRGDKVSRCHSIVPILAQGLVYAPNISWSDDLLLPELANFPYGKHDDLVDSTTMALNFLRTTGRIQTDVEIQAAERERLTHRSPRRLPYRV